MTTSLLPLIQFHVNAMEQMDDADARVDDLAQSLAMLNYAQAVRNKINLSDANAQLPRQVVAVGPTQAGKSTLVNLLLGLTQATVSAHAGYTVHCQGFTLAESDISWLPSFFTEASLVDQGALQRDILGEYSCTAISDSVPDDVAAAFGNTVLWDTPDFDSVSHSSYRSSVLHSIALADLVLMVVSKEKYADRSVWDVLQMLAVAGKQVVLVINKTPEGVRKELLASVQAKVESLSKKLVIDFAPPVLFVDEAQDPIQALRKSTDVDAVRGVIHSLQKPGVDLQHENLHRFINFHWRNWTTGITEQHSCQREWRQLVEAACDSLLHNYDREFLEHKRHDETLQLAVAELLVLLEIPGLAEPLTKIRNLITWPARKVLRSALKIDSDIKKHDKRSEEQRLLESLYDHCLTDLVSQVASRQQAESDGSQWWLSLQSDLLSARAGLKKGWESESDNYQTLLKVETERAARSLYKKLEEQPAMLNSLRAARVTADAAAVVLAVKSGGLGAADLVVAPAVLSLTTMLTESALGQYMKKVQQELRRYQKKSLSGMVNRKLKIKLQTLAGSSSSEVTPSTLAALAGSYRVSGSESQDV